MKDLDAKLDLEKVVSTGVEPNDADGPLTTALLEDVRYLLVELVNELRTIRAQHCGLPWPEHAVKSESKPG